MNFFDLLSIAVGLAMDAFAISICKGLDTKEKFLKTGVVCGIWFGVFQGLMPFFGWLLGQTVAEYVEKYSGIVTFGLLAFLGVKMLVDTLKEWREEQACEICGAIEEQKNSGELIPAPAESNKKANPLAPWIMFTMAIATSIDALAAGLAFASEGANITLAITIVGLVTFSFCFVGSILGAKIGSKFKTPAGIAGGIILIAMGLKFLLF